MMMNIKYEAKLWNDTINEYIKFTRKSAEEATFRQAKNLLFFVSREMPQSRFRKNQGITRLSEYFRNREWVAGMIVAKYFKRKGSLIIKLNHKQKGVIGRAVMMRGARGRFKFAQWHDGNRRAVYFTKEMAIKENEKRRKRINARFGFAQLVPLKAVDALRRVAQSNGINIGAFKVKGDKPNRRYQGEDAIVSLKKDNGRIDMSIVSSYRFKSQFTMFGKLQDANAQFYDSAIAKALPRAMINAIADMREYMRRKMQEQARKLNRR